MSAIPAAIGLMLVFLAVFAAIFGYFLAIGIRQTEERLVERSSAAAQVVSSHAFWIAEVAHQTLRRVDAALGPTMSGSMADLGPVLEGLPSVTQVYIIDAQARTIYATVEGASTVSVADRDYFIAVRDGASFYTSPLLVSRLTGERIFVFSKRVERAGEFAGAIMVSFPESLLEELWRNLDLEGTSTLSLARNDGQLIARFPPTEGPVDLSQTRLFTEHLTASDTGTYTSESSPVDGVARVVSYRRVPGTSIIAIASVGSAETWANFRGAVVTVFIIVSPIVLGLVLGCAWIVRLLYRDAAQAKALQASLEANTMLFREIHHRVKNNLQSVQSLVRMQDLPQAAKLDLQSRFAAMAAMHEHIYKHDRYEDIDAHDFIPAVVDEVMMAYGSDAVVHYAVDHIPVDRDHATPLALLLSELVTNACKYAVADGGTITVGLSQGANGRAQLTVRDSGAGIEPERMAGGSMGMRLIKGVVAQMDGTHSFRTDGGTVFEADIALSTGVRNG
ncbi:MAG TPA: cache domain-containing protein [Devosia sp.]|nr:cache domain-containing protein [Devosia sp.]